jgi:MoaA/NifB/PqqE/SkfB family radical SAM enzyme
MQNPYVATIEPVSTCPVKCEMCPVSRSDVPQPKARLMAFDVAGAVAARLRHEFGVESLCWGNWGEPLVHPELPALAAAFERVGIEHQYLSTSASVKFDVEALVLSHVSHVDVSISGITADVYNIGHAHGRWDLVRSNIEAIAELRRRHPGRINAGIRWHRYKHNEHQLEEARAWCESLDIEFRPYYAHLGGIEALHDWDHGTLPESKKNFVNERVFLDFVRRSLAKHENETSCPMTQNLIIHSDGTLLHCCGVMTSHQDGREFLRLSKEEIIGYKEAPNRFCGECLQKGWAGYMHSPKDDAHVEGVESVASSAAS